MLFRKDDGMVIICICLKKKLVGNVFYLIYRILLVFKNVRDKDFINMYIGFF